MSEVTRPPKPDTLAGYGCDWGDCMDDDVDYRWSDEHGWLAVCAKHREPSCCG